MTLSHFNRSEIHQNILSGDVLEKVIIGNDLSCLSSIEKVQYVTGLCKTLNLNPLTKPIQLMKFQNKEIPYFTKDSTEQLRKNNNISIVDMKTQMLDGGLYVVTATARTPDGRQDSSTGAIVIAGLKGDALANALMKAETKAKRRVTLSICGLGFIDECEAESIPNAVKVDIQYDNNKIESHDVDTTDIELYYAEFAKAIEESKSIDDLQKVFFNIKKVDFRQNSQLLKNLVEMKDKKKLELTYSVNTIDIDLAS